jgi:limonene-1,2-epoxide hydrolase
VPDATPDQIVRSFIAALERADLAAATRMVTDDVEYDNVPMRAVHGPAGITESLTPFFAGCTEIDWVIHHQVSTGDRASGTVMNERTDRFLMGGRWVELGVAGLFLIRDGRIALWRDYFDLGQFQRAVAGDDQ